MHFLIQKLAGWKSYNLQAMAGVLIVYIDKFSVTFMSKRSLRCNIDNYSYLVIFNEVVHFHLIAIYVSYIDVFK